LSLVALAFGASQARAIDNDADVIGVVRENAERNAFAARVEADATDIADITKKYPVVVANIEADVLIKMSAALAKSVEARGLLVLSGILAPQQERVRAAFSQFEWLDTPARGEWIALVLRAS
jgi:ribosomal protein L11 methyltransferase